MRNSLDIHINNYINNTLISITLIEKQVIHFAVKQSSPQKKSTETDISVIFDHSQIVIYILEPQKLLISMKNGMIFMVKTTFGHRMAALLPLSMILILAACSNGAAADAEPATTAVVAEDSGIKAEALGLIEPYLGKATDFPVTEKLEQLPTGKRVAYLALNTPTEAATFADLKMATDMLGIDLIRIPTGSGAADVSAAANSAAQLKPDAVMVIGLDPIMYQPALRQLEEDGVPVIGAALTNAEEHGIIPIGGPAYNAASGKAMADFVISQEGTAANSVFYNLAELGFSQEIRAAFESEYKRLCDTCNLRVVDIPMASLGTTAPNTISNDLQANPNTTHAILAAGDIGIGLPSALKRSNLEVKLVTNSPTEANLQYLQEGQEQVAFALDGKTYMFTIVDAIARVTTGQDLDPSQVDGIGYPVGMLRPSDELDPSVGFLPYPDYVERFAELWGAES